MSNFFSANTEIMNLCRAFSISRKMDCRRSAIALFVLCVVMLGSAGAQTQPFLTSRGDNNRSGSNTSETLLTPADVNKQSFGHQFSFPVDYEVLAQPLYVPNVNIPGQGVHNVVYVVTMLDSVYAIDADTGTQLWYASMLDGGTIATDSYLPCGSLGGFDQEGIVGTPVIDPTTNTMYLVAKSVRNGFVRHDLHALDITTGNEQVSMGSPIQIAATSTSDKGHVTVFNSLHQKNRPGLLLLNGVLYLGFGSNGCNDHNSGWVLSYSASNLQQLNVFNTSPDSGLTSIWQSGNGIAGDDEGNIFFETAESSGYDVPSGGQSFCNSVLALSPDLQINSFFTPWNVAFLNQHDLDLSSSGVLVLPDQPNPPTHLAIASGKQGTVYVLDRDSMGGYVAGGGPIDTQIVQELPFAVGAMFSSPAYWNNTVYFAGDAAPIMAYPIVNGQLGTPVTSGKYTGAHSPMISANGNTNGIVWVLSGNNLDAFNAVSLTLLYSSNQSGTRDTLPKLAHFATPTVAAGRVYVATQTSLEAYGLFHIMSINGGNNQSAPVLTALPVPVQIEASDPYTGQPLVGVPIAMSDGGKGGGFNPVSGATDTNGNFSTVYTLPKKTGTYTLTATSEGFAPIAATATATPAAVAKIISYKGTKQTGVAGSVLANPVVAEALDVYSNPVPGITVTFAANQGGVANPASAVTAANGQAGTSLQLPTLAGTITLTASSSGLKNVTFPEYSIAGPAASATVNGGNNQSGTAGTMLPQALTVLVADQYGNPVSGVAVAFSDGNAGGTFSSPNPATTGTNGVASISYTLPLFSETVTITGTANAVTNPAVFTETSE